METLIMTPSEQRLCDQLARVTGSFVIIFHLAPCEARATAQGQVSQSGIEDMWIRLRARPAARDSLSPDLSRGQPLLPATGHVHIDILEMRRPASFRV